MREYRGTGFVLGSNAVATAAHVIYNGETGKYPDSVKVVPAKNGSVEPYGSVGVATAQGKNLIVSSGFISNPGPDHDWGIILLDTDIGSKTGWMGIRWQSASYNNLQVWNTGYPTIVDGESAGKKMYVGTGAVRDCTENQFQGTWDASRGNSGGPVFGYYSDGDTVIGIFTSGSKEINDGSAYPEAHSTATRITKEMFDLFMLYR